MVELAKNTAFQTIFLSASSDKCALSGGKNMLSGGWADRSPPVWAEH